VISGLISRLKLENRQVTMRHLKPTFVPQLRDQPNSIVVDPHGKPMRGAFLSLVKIVAWLMEEWYFTLFQEKKETLLICDRYYHDLLVDPKRYRFGAPLWTARLIGRVMPMPRLWILLNAPAEVLQARKQEVAHEETARQVGAYLKFIRSRSRHVIVDASQPLDKVIADAHQAINRELSE
jgi:thymidylate kinase